MIPKLIHHIWIGDNKISPTYLEFIEKWKGMYSDYSFLYWNNEMVKDSGIITEDIEKYFNSNINIALKADLLRFKILEKFGGLYIDVDTEPLRRMPDTILSYDFFSGYQPNNEIAIGIMGSSLNNILVERYIKSVLSNISSYTDSYGSVSNDIWKISGPEYFTSFLQPYIDNINYKFFESKYFYPYSWMEMHRRYEDFSITSPESYSVHHWAKNW